MVMTSFRSADAAACQLEHVCGLARVTKTLTIDLQRNTPVAETCSSVRVRFVPAKAYRHLFANGLRIQSHNRGASRDLRLVRSRHGVQGLHRYVRLFVHLTRAILTGI